MDENHLQDVASEAVAVLTSALQHRLEGLSETATVDYHRDIRAVIEGKSELELAVVIATLGDISVELLRAIADASGKTPQALLQELALTLRRSWSEGS